MIKKTYKNIIELADENNLRGIWAGSHYDGLDGLENYMDKYSDMDIVDRFLSDVMPEDIQWESFPIWSQGQLSWRKCKIQIK